MGSRHPAQRRQSLPRHDRPGWRGTAGDRRAEPPRRSACSPKALIYEARKHDEPGIFLYSLPLDGHGTQKLAFHDPKLNGWMRDVSRDGRRALVFELLTLSERALVAVDLESGHAQRLYPPAGVSATITSARFSPDGRRVFVATEHGRHAVLLALDASSGQELARQVDRGTELEDIVVSADGKRVAATALVGVRTELRFYDGTALTPLGSQPQLPLGIGSPSAFTPDGRELTVS
jgi:hypothetical protein